MSHDARIDGGWRSPAAVVAVALLLQAAAVTVYADGSPGLEVDPATGPSQLPGGTENLDELQLRYEENVGQFHEDVAYAAHGPGPGLYLTDEASAVFALALDGDRASDDRPGVHEPRAMDTEAAKTAHVRMDLVGANDEVDWRGEGELTSYSNYLVGEREDWVTGVPHVEKAIAEDVYEGIDLAWHATSAGTPKFDLLVEPGGNPDTVELGFDGAEELGVRQDGSLVVDAGPETIVQPAPYAYQTIDGERVEVEASYALEDGVVGFELGSYDEAEPLVIDPEVKYGTHLGGDDNREWPMDVLVDDQGYTYVVGHTRSEDFPTSEGAYEEDPIAPGLRYDGFATKLTQDGSDIVYSTYFGTEGTDYAAAGADVTEDGDLLVGGHTSGFEEFGGYSTGFLGLLDEDGTDMEFFVPLGSDDEDHLLGGVAAGDDGFYAGGQTFGDAIRLGDDDPFRTSPQSQHDTFVAKVSTDGEQLEWVREPTAGTSARIYGLDADGGTVAVSGYDEAGNLDTSEGAYQAQDPGGASSTFVVTYDGGGNTTWATYAANAGTDRVRTGGLAVAEDGTVALAGYTNAGPDEDRYRAFVVKLRQDGSDAQFHEVLETSDEDSYAYGVDILDATGHVYLVGNTVSHEVPITEDAFQETRPGDTRYDPDGFLTVFDPAGEVAFGSYWGGEDSDYMRAGADVGSHGEVAIAGYTSSYDIPTSDDAFQPERPDIQAAYVALLQPFDPPTEPLAVHAEATGPTVVELSWDPPTDDGGLALERYIVYRSAQGGELQRIGTTAGTSFTDTTAQPGTEHTYAIAAVNPVGEGPASETASALTPPSGPRNLEASPGEPVLDPGAPGSVHLDWDPPGDPEDPAITAYHVYRADAADNPIASVAGDVTEYSDEGLALVDTEQPGLAEYTYWVTAENPAGEGAPSEEASSSTVPPAIGEP